MRKSIIRTRKQAERERSEAEEAAFPDEIIDDRDTEAEETDMSKVPEIEEASGGEQVETTGAKAQGAPEMSPLDVQALLACINSMKTNMESKLDSMQTNMNSMQTKIEENNSMQTDMKKEMSIQNENMNKKLDSKLGNLQTNIDSKFETINNKFDSKFESMESKFESVESVQADIQENLNNIQTNIQEDLNSIQTSIEESMEKKFENMQISIKERIDDKFNDMNSKFERMKEETKKEMEEFWKEMDNVNINLNTQIEGIAEKIDQKVETKLNGIEGQVREVTQELEVTKETIQVQLEDTTKSLDKKLQDNCAKIAKTQEKHNLEEIERRNRELMNELVPRINRIELQATVGGRSTVLQGEGETPKFRGSEKNPIENLKRIKEWLKLRVDNLHNWEVLKVQMDNVFVSNSNVWWRIVRDTIKEWKEFEQVFNLKYWNNERQRIAKESIEFGKYDPKYGTNRCDYFLHKCLLLRNLSHIMSEADIVLKLAGHFDHNIKETCIIQNIMTVASMQQLLSRYDSVNLSSDQEMCKPTMLSNYKEYHNTANNYQNRNRTEPNRNRYNTHHNIPEHSYNVDRRYHNNNNNYDRNCNHPYRRPDYQPNRNQIRGNTHPQYQYNTNTRGYNPEYTRHQYHNSNMTNNRAENANNQSNNNAQSSPQYNYRQINREENNNEHRAHVNMLRIVSDEDTSIKTPDDNRQNARETIDTGQ